MAEKGGNSTRKEKGLGKAINGKQEEGKHSKLRVKREKGLKRVTFKDIEKSENMSMIEIFREVREAARKEIRELKEDWKGKKKEQEVKWKEWEGKIESLENKIKELKIIL